MKKEKGGVSVGGRVGRDGQGVGRRRMRGEREDSCLSMFFLIPRTSWDMFQSQT